MGNEWLLNQDYFDENGNKRESLKWVEDFNSENTAYVTTCGRYKVEQIRDDEACETYGGSYYYWIINGDHDLQYDHLIQACGEAQSHAWGDFDY